jgi:hypothetical protein
MAKPSNNLKTSVQGFTNSRRNLLSAEQWLAPGAADVRLNGTLEPHTAWSILAPCIVARSQVFGLCLDTLGTRGHGPAPGSSQKASLPKGAGVERTRASRVWWHGWASDDRTGQR